MDDMLGPAAVDIYVVYEDVEGIQSSRDYKGERCAGVGGVVEWPFKSDISLGGAAGSEAAELVMGDSFVNHVQDPIIGDSLDSWPIGFDNCYRGI